MSSPSPRLVAAVAAGGALGTLGRHAVVTWTGEVGGLPLGTLVVNLVGSLLLGVVVAMLGSSPWRMALGTGVLGGFTTYSALAVETHELMGPEPGLALAYAATTILGGWALALVGLVVGRRWQR
ncbi:fluoride efflux transporter FluC [Aeromicrobium sp. CF4.19]|uniref:fluoride efflux transporter FluC n=1 Tax=Aeromicrobium sp. CF4.19 TaxID=3373082 RepID=UPI003EE61283